MQRGNIGWIMGDESVYKYPIPSNCDSILLFSFQALFENLPQPLHEIFIDITQYLLHLLRLEWYPYLLIEFRNSLHLQCHRTLPGVQSVGDAGRSLYTALQRATITKETRAVRTTSAATENASLSCLMMNGESLVRTLHATVEDQLGA